MWSGFKADYNVAIDTDPRRDYWIIMLPEEVTISTMLVVLKEEYDCDDRNYDIYMAGIHNYGPENLIVNTNGLSGYF